MNTYRDEHTGASRRHEAQHPSPHVRVFKRMEPGDGVFIFIFAGLCTSLRTFSLSLTIFLLVTTLLIYPSPIHSFSFRRPYPHAPPHALHIHTAKPASAPAQYFPATLPMMHSLHAVFTPELGSQHIAEEGVEIERVSFAELLHSRVPVGVESVGCEGGACGYFACA